METIAIYTNTAIAANPSYENCANHTASCSSCGTNCYYAVSGRGSDKTMTVYGPTTTGTTESVDTPVLGNHTKK